jgi:hypothetical protein
METEEKNFNDLRQKFTCKCGCGRNNTTDDFLSKISFAQTITGIDYPITSGCRCPQHNVEVEGSQDSPSLYGAHADIANETPFNCFLIIKGLLMAGLERFRIYPHHIHVDQHPTYPIPSFVWANYPPKIKKEV